MDMKNSVAVRLGNIKQRNTICIKLFKSRSTRIKKKVEEGQKVIIGGS